VIWAKWLVHVRKQYLRRAAAAGRRFHRKGVFEDISFVLRECEILTFFGLVGAGRTEMAQALVGLDKPTGGKIYLRNQLVQITRARCCHEASKWSICQKIAKMKVCF
jgi:ABC-type sugar transport system ATPase subunit